MLWSVLPGLLRVLVYITATYLGLHSACELLVWFWVGCAFAFRCDWLFFGSGRVPGLVPDSPIACIYLSS